MKTSIDTNREYSVDDIPTDRKAFVKHYEPCPNAPVVTIPTEPRHATIAELVEYLRTIRNTRNGSFATSLVEYYERTKTLSEKQAVHARRLYGQYYDACVRYARDHGGQHDWKYVGDITTYSNIYLGTYRYTDYHRCAQCGGWQAYTTDHNYSGD